MRDILHFPKPGAPGVTTQPTTIPLEAPLGSFPGAELPALLDRPAGQARFAVLLAHGAGAPMDHPFLERVAGDLAQAGGIVLRFDYPYMAARRAGANRRPPDRAPVLLAAHAAAIDAARKQAGSLPLFLAGKSLGSRIAAMSLAGEGTQPARELAGLVAFGYPLHPAGKPDQLRDGFFGNLEAPCLFVQGTRDALCTRELLELSIERLPGPKVVHWTEDGDHSLEVRKSSGRTSEEALAEADAAVVAWIEQQIGT